MSNKELVIGAVSQLPEDVTMEEIAREIEFLAGISVAREQARRGEGIPADEVRKLIEIWARQSS